MSSNKYHRSQLALAISSSLAVSATQAATISVDTLADPGSPETCSLRSAIQALNTQASVDACYAGNGVADEIIFEPGLTGTMNLSEGGLEITSDVLITGPGTDNLTIDAGGNSGIFRISDGSSTRVTGLTLTGGYASFGGAFYVYSSRLELNDVVITNSQAQYNGGAIELYGGELDVFYGSFRNNSALDNGGAIAVTSGSAAVIQSEFSGNYADVGGALQVNFYATSNPPPRGLPALDASLIVYGGNLTGNQARAGGAIGAGYSGNVPIANSRVARSQVTEASSTRGGRPYNLYVNNSYIENNTAQYGGGIAALRTPGPAPVGVDARGDTGPVYSNTIRLQDSYVGFNEADFGGGVAAENSRIYSDNSFIAYNTANLSGGGVFMAPEFGYSGPIRGGTNVVDSYLYAAFSGIYSNEVTYAPIPRGADPSPLAGSGGGISQSYGVSALLYSRVQDNDAPYRGGGILARDGYSIAVYSTISGNSGGGIYSEGSEIVIGYSRVIGNIGSTVGPYSGSAGLQCEFASACEIAYSEVSSNSGAEFGAIAAGIRDIGIPSTVSIRNSTVSGNTGNRVGGIASPYLDLVFSTVAFNESIEEAVTSRGAPIFSSGGIFSSGAAQISNSIVSGNTSFSGNADIGTDGGSVTMNHSLIGDSTSLSYSGGNNLLDVDPLLAPLDLNGGFARNGRTHALGPGSPAINAGLAETKGKYMFDQRGYGFTRGLGGDADIGAYEVQVGSSVDLLFSDRFE